MTTAADTRQFWVGGRASSNCRVNEGSGHARAATSSWQCQQRTTPALVILHDLSPSRTRLYVSPICGMTPYVVPSIRLTRIRRVFSSCESAATRESFRTVAASCFLPRPCYVDFIPREGKKKKRNVAGRTLEERRSPLSLLCIDKSDGTRDVEATVCSKATVSSAPVRCFSEQSLKSSKQALTGDCPTQDLA